MAIVPVTAVGVTDPSAVTSITSLYDQMSAGLGSADVGSIENVSVPGVNSLTAGQAAATRSDSFGSMLGQGLQKVENLDTTAQTKAINAATGDLDDVHDYVIAAVQAQTAVELTTTLRNKALESFQQIIGMQL
ncbi:flagellar hook-basal body complex protein FliE [Kineosporia sp. J2-2]|uniref:Flagellar hook-basal body complex protein FliE n=1 Tax=Kineosporia corallincola TaxID=2835133 RepID=A0ABS5TK04_9ACTN|nr:flagellar hook-basal body complex protein FliE [Kineosporia corallincola]MBT0771417.1 flagellar hook-basal body complex protein FliE [Kineosporia corallincola]